LGEKAASKFSSVVLFTVNLSRTLRSSIKLLLCVDESGTIQFPDNKVESAADSCEKYSGFKHAACTTLKPLQFLFPDMIDMHMHAPQWPNMAISIESDLIEWFENYTDPLEASYKDNKARRVYDEMVRKE
jgi:guanine deaminase